MGLLVPPSAPLASLIPRVPPLRSIDRLVSQNRSSLAGGCTGMVANWCPIHGHCTCPLHFDGNHIVVPACDIATRREIGVYVFYRVCPLHGPASLHAS